MYTGDRRVKEVYQEPLNLNHVTTRDKLKNHRELKDLPTSVDEFGSPQYSHVVEIKADMAAVAAVLSFPEKKIYMDLIKGIDNANSVDVQKKCLVKYAAGKLTDEEIDKI